MSDAPFLWIVFNRVLIAASSSFFPPLFLALRPMLCPNNVFRAWAKYYAKVDDATAAAMTTLSADGFVLDITRSSGEIVADVLIPCVWPLRCAPTCRVLLVCPTMLHRHWQQKPFLLLGEHVPVTCSVR